jgi:hypothetical protein
VKRIVPMTTVLLLTLIAACSSSGALSPGTSPASSPPGPSQPTPTATTAVPSGTGLACAIFTSHDFTQVYGTALASVTGSNGNSAVYGKSSSCTYAMNAPNGANVAVELNCGYGAQLFWEEEETESYQTLTGGPPGAVEQLDGNGLPLAMMLTADGVYLSIDDESVGPTPPGLNPVPDTKVTEAMNLAYANVQSENPCG